MAQAVFERSFKNGGIMKDGPAYQMYAQDFDMDTATWKNKEIGVYVRLLNYEWVNGGLPTDLKELAQIAREKNQIFNKIWIKTVSSKFQDAGQNKFINRKMEEVREKQRKYREVQSQRGKKSALKRWGENITGVITEPVIDSVKIRLQPDCNSSSSSSSSLNNNKHNIPDSVFLEELKTKYYWIDFNQTMIKIDGWLSVHPERKKTRRFIINWLNKIEKPISISNTIKKETPNPEIIPKNFIRDPNGQKKLKEIINSLSKEKTIPQENL